MAQQHLNDAQIGPIFQQMGCKAMPYSELCREINVKRPERPAECGAGRYAHLKVRHSPEVGSELLQKRQQFVVGLESFGSSFYGIGLSQSLFFQCEVSIEIDLSGFNRLMAEPKSNHRAIHPSLEQFHGRGVPKDMRGYALLSQGSAVFSRLRHVACEQVLNTISAQGSTTRTGE